MKRVNIILTFILILIFSSCDRFKRSRIEGQIRNENVKISYFKDNASGLCFAEFYSVEGDKASYTTVPCDSVKYLIYNRNIILFNEN